LKKEGSAFDLPIALSIFAVRCREPQWERLIFGGLKRLLRSRRKGLTGRGSFARGTPSRQQSEG